MRQVVLEARQRVFGLSEDQSLAMPETSVLGHLRAIGELSRRQYEAGAKYRQVVRDYDRFMLLKGLPKAGDMDRGAGHDGEDGTAPEYVAAFDRAIADYRQAEAALQDANREDHVASAAAKAVVLSDLSVPHFTPALKIALNRLAHVLKLPVEREEAA